MIEAIIPSIPLVFAQAIILSIPFVIALMACVMIYLDRNETGE